MQHRIQTLNKDMPGLMLSPSAAGIGHACWHEQHMAPAAQQHLVAFQGRLLEAACQLARCLHPQERPLAAQQ